MSDDLTKLMNGNPATFSSGYAGKGEESVYDRTGFPPVEIAPSFPMSDDLIKRSDVLFMIDAFQRDFEQSWRVQFRANIYAIPEVKDERIEALLAELEGGK
jgi:hypothetical protein